MKFLKDRASNISKNQSFSRIAWIFICVMGITFLISWAEDPGNYRFPIDRFRALSGTFGELRSNHFHSGIDIKVGGVSGAPIYAIADGYVYRIKVSPFGYGNALYLRHADEKFSVYGHLQRFTDSLQSYVREIQYQSQRFDQEIYPEIDEIKVQKGQLIGYAGNTGRSFGPHLHFEIRDPDERILNPLHFYPGEIKDNIKPILQHIAFEPIDIDSRIMGDFDKYTLTPRSAGGSYTIDPIIRIRGRVGLQYHAYDLLNAARNHCGINHAKLYLDDSLIFSFDLTRFAFDETRYINQHFDYKYNRAQKRKYQKAYVDAGNRFSAYGEHENKGLIYLEDDAIHNYRLELSDAYKNTAVVSGRIQRDKADIIPDRLTSSNNSRFDIDIRHNILKLSVSKAHPTHLEGINYADIYGRTSIWKPSYYQNGKLVFLKPLERNHYPDHISDLTGQLNEYFYFREEIDPSQNNYVQFQALRLYFPYRSVFECTPLQIFVQPNDEKTLTPKYEIGNPDQALFRSYWVSLIKPEEAPEGKTVMAMWNKEDKEWSYLGHEEGNSNNIIAQTRSFGTVALLVDSIAPEIKALNFKEGATISTNQSRLRIDAPDDFSGLNYQKIGAWLDGQWILCYWDSRNDVITWTWDQRPAPGQHSLRLKLEDWVGNVNEKTFNLYF